MKRFLLPLAGVLLLGCGPKEKKEAPPPEVSVGAWAETNFWAFRVDSVKDIITPGMDRYYQMVYLTLKNISQTEQPLSAQLFSFVVLLEKKGEEEVRYEFDPIVSNQESKKRGWSLEKVVAPGDTTKVLLAFSLPSGVKPPLLRVTDGMGPKFALVKLQ